MDTESINNSSKEKVSPDDLYNLIQDIQSKLNITEENTTKVEHTNEKELKNNEKTVNDNNNLNFLQNLDLSSLLNILGQKKQEDNNSFNIDPNMILKLQRIITSINKDDPRKDLLISLKPFLRKSRQDKLSEYLNIMTILNALSAFNDKEGSDNNVI